MNIQTHLLSVAIEVSSDKCMIARQKAADQKRVTKGGQRLSNNRNKYVHSLPLTKRWQKQKMFHGSK